jgi:hypothetical protein
LENLLGTLAGELAQGVTFFGLENQALFAEDMLAGEQRVARHGKCMKSGVAM